MEQWVSFVQDKWILIVIALIVLLVVVNIVKSAVKWLIVIVIAAGLWFYGANYTEQIKDVGGQLLEYSKAEAVKALIGESGDAQYKLNTDGTYEITTKNFIVKGKTDSNEAEITFKGQSFTIRLDDALKKFIEEAAKQTSA